MCYLALLTNERIICQPFLNFASLRVDFSNKVRAALGYLEGFIALTHDTTALNGYISSKAVYFDPML